MDHLPLNNESKMSLLDLEAIGFDAICFDATGFDAICVDATGFDAIGLTRNYKLE